MLREEASSSGRERRVGLQLIVKVCSETIGRDETYAVGSGGSTGERATGWEWVASTALDQRHSVAAGKRQEEA